MKNGLGKRWLDRYVERKDTAEKKGVEKMRKMKGWFRENEI